MQDLEDMLGFRPCLIYFYLWKYVSPICLIILISASVIEMAINPPGYNAWVQELVSQFLHVCVCAVCHIIMHDVTYDDISFSSQNILNLFLNCYFFPRPTSPVPSLCVCRLRNASRATLPGHWACVSLSSSWPCFLSLSSSLPVTST